MKVYFFGVWDARKGHFLVDTTGRTVHDERHATPWESHDAVLCPGYRGQYDNGPEVQGAAALHHRGGWTALAFWDRSVDTRGGCNSVFFAEGTYGPEAMVEIARAAFPRIWARFTFAVRIVERPGDVENPRHRCPACGKIGYGAHLEGWRHDPAGWFRKDNALRCSVACVTALPPQEAPSCRS